MDNGTTLTSLSSSSSQSTDDSISDRLSSRSISNNQSGFFQRFIGLGRLATQYSSSKTHFEHGHEQFTFIVHFLDETERIYSIDRHSYGSELFNKVFDFNDERDYFGLLIDESTNHWLEPNKSLRKQFQNVASPIHLDMKIRFFPVDPSNELKCDFTKYLFVLQLKKDIFNEKLFCSPTTSALLASYLVQIELGDYSTDSHSPGYLRDSRFVRFQNSEFESQIEHFHKQHRGQSASECERNYLRLASSLELYGIELHQVSVKVCNSSVDTSSSTVDLQLGVNAIGLTVFQNSSKLNIFSWNRISKISYKRRTFSIQLIKDTASTEENLIVFTVRNYFTCKCLWKSCVDHHTFFRHWTIPKLRMTESSAQKSAERMSTQQSDNEKLETNFSAEKLVEPSIIENDPTIRIVKLYPNDNGRYGFNLKVNIENDFSKRSTSLMNDDDERRTIVIAKVIEETPASRASLHEGDILIAVNQIDVQQMTREEVLDLVRQSRLDFQGPLQLWIKPVEIDDRQEKQKHSVEILRDDLQSNRFVEQYNALSRRDQNLTFHIATQKQNVPLNRYRDVLPYDQTRVILQTDPHTDYINANHIEIPIQDKEIINRYIATQGPLPTTCVAFWRMIWEQNCFIVLMLTPLIESGRIKCHQYWPDVFQSITYDCFTISCQKERMNNDFIYREFLVYNQSTDEERCIYQIQNHLWPDHGVPEDCSSFLESLAEVRNLKKQKLDSPVLVHCSAGIGRTGVFILIETGLSLIEQNQTVFPLDIVRKMREQRMGMIQTASQYQFACQAILFAYDGGLIGR